MPAQEALLARFSKSPIGISLQTPRRLLGLFCSISFGDTFVYSGLRVNSEKGMFTKCLPAPLSRPNPHMTAWKILTFLINSWLRP